VSYLVLNNINVRKWEGSGAHLVDRNLECQFRRVSIRTMGGQGSGDLFSRQQFSKSSGWFGTTKEKIAVKLPGSVVWEAA